jgi:predicted signal transduction protein with EAL and GGDEF domain
MNSAFRKALTVALLSIAASLLLGGALLPLLGAQLDPVAVVMCVVTPFAIAFPVSLHTFRKKEELLVAHERLAEAHSQLAAAHRRLAEKAIRDDLTGMLNREAILDHLRTACDRPAASALLMIDADDFKKVNDTHGHMVGDEALKATKAYSTSISARATSFA